MFVGSRFDLTFGLFICQSLAGLGPCDIYASGNTPCVAAHSTTRALYKSYNDSLYQVRRTSDNEATDITPLSAGGIADSATQDRFCAGTICLVTLIYDQSGNNNHLSQAPPGQADTGPDANGYDALASAIGAPVTLNGQKAYGIFVSPNVGYRNDNATGTAKGNAPEGIYAVLDGTHYNDQCCFDYGNAETNNQDIGPGYMEAIYFGNNTDTSTGAGDGPWIMVDMEDVTFAGSSESNDPNDPSISWRFVNAMIKGGVNRWAIRGANAASGELATYYNGTRPAGYEHMHKQGAIILGIGGDNSLGAQGTFYEGAMTSGYPSDATENEVQANIVAAGYAVTSLNSGPVFKTGSTISLRATNTSEKNQYIVHTDDDVVIKVCSSSNTTTEKQTASWKVHAGLAYDGCYSFESIDRPGSYIRQVQYDFDLQIESDDGSAQFADEATFCGQTPLNGQGNSIRSWSYPTRYFRRFESVLYGARDGGPEEFDATASFNDGASFVQVSAFATCVLSASEGCHLHFISM